MTVCVFIVFPVLVAAGLVFLVWSCASVSSGVWTKTVCNNLEPGKTVLTFDDGPRPEVTPWVLEQLDKYGAKATFFCIGKNVELFPDLFEEVKRRGHAVGNHSYSHIKGWGVPTGDYVRDIDIASDMINSNLLRPPYARITPAQARVLSERYKIVMWSIISRDYNRKLSAEQCAGNVIKELEAGDIIVFHDSIKCAPNLFEALPVVLEEIKRRNLVCRRIDL